MKTLSQRVAEKFKVYVENPSKRGLDTNGNCRYQGDKGPCIVGAFMKRKDRVTADREAMGDVTYIAEHANDLIPAFVQDNLNLFSELQKLHDGKPYWGKDGFNSLGKLRLEEIIAEFNLDLRDFDYVSRETTLSEEG